MATNTLGIEPFKWDDETTPPTYFALYFERFERAMRLLQVVVADAETDQDVNLYIMDSLITVGGNQLMERIVEIKDYNKLTYAVIKKQLEKVYLCKNIKLNEYKFMKTKPEPDEKLKDYVRRLRAAGILAQITSEHTILMQILVNTSSEKIKNKIMTKDCTLDGLLEWQETFDHTLLINADENRMASVKMEQTNEYIASRRQQNQQNKLHPIRQTTTPTAASNIHTAQNNKFAERVPAKCFYCNENYPHTNGECPARFEYCNYCNKQGHREICCFQRMTNILGLQKPKQIKRSQQVAQHQTSTITNTKPIHQQATQQRNAQTMGAEARQAQHQNTSAHLQNHHNTQQQQQQIARPVGNIQTDDFCDDANCTLCHPRQSCVKHVDNIACQRLRPIINVDINGTIIKILLDSGSDIDGFKKSSYDSMHNRPKLETTTLSMRSYNATHTQQLLGYFNATVTINNIKQTIKFYVFNDQTEHVDNVLSFASLKEFKIDVIQYEQYNCCSILREKLNKQDKHEQQKLAKRGEELKKRMQRQFPRVFEDRIGLIPNLFVTIEVDDSIKPTQKVSQNIAYSLVPGTEKKLEYLQQQNVCIPVPPGSNIGYISPIRVVPKGGVDSDGHPIVRITINCVDLNKAVKKKHRLMPNKQSIVRKLNGSKLFTKIDIKDAFHTIALDEASMNYTVFSTHHGLLKQTRLWMGLCISSELYNEVMSAKMSHLSATLNAIDDIAVHTTYDFDLHELRVTEAFALLDELNLTVSNKCSFMTTEMEFWGMIISEQGIRPKAQTIKDLLESEVPTTANELISFLCLAAYFMERIPKLATISEPLWLICKKNAVFNWAQQHNEAFELIKKKLITDCLSHYQEEAETELWVDAGPRGRAAFLVQIQLSIRRLIACASKRNSISENNYSQVEKECKACVWAVDHFKTFLYGKRFKLLTDNKSCFYILNQNHELKKPTTMRMQNWKSYLVQFHRMEVVHVPGKTNIADFLSRCMNKQTTIQTEKVIDLQDYTFPEDDEEFQIASLTHYIKAITLADIAKATDKDIHLKVVKQLIENGNTYLAKSQDPIWNNATQFYRVNYNEISVSQEGCLIWNDLIIIPDELSDRIIELTHEGHGSGINSCKRLIRDNYYFKNIDKLVQQHVETCLPCQANTDVSPIHPIQPTMIPSKAWSDLDCDYTSKSPDGDYNFVLIDEFSRMVECIQTKDLTTDSAIASLKTIFAKHGIPKSLKCDNGPAFKSEDFKRFLKSLNIKYCPVTPLWPRANGMAERMMKNINKVIRCALAENRPWKPALKIYLRNYRATPHSMTKFSPNELMGYPNDVKFPTCYKSRTLESITSTVIANDLKSKSIMKHYADINLNTKAIQYNINDKVLVKYDDSIKPAIKSYKYKSLYDPKPYQITNIMGTMISAKREFPKHKTTRNISFFRQLKIKHSKEEDVNQLFNKILDKSKYEIIPQKTIQAFMFNNQIKSKDVITFLRDRRLANELNEQEKRNNEIKDNEIKRLNQIEHEKQTAIESTKLKEMREKSEAEAVEKFRQRAIQQHQLDTQLRLDAEARKADNKRIEDEMDRLRQINTNTDQIRQVNSPNLELDTSITELNDLIAIAEADLTKAAKHMDECHRVLSIAKHTREKAISDFQLKEQKANQTEQIKTASKRVTLVDSTPEEQAMLPQNASNEENEDDENVNNQTIVSSTKTKIDYRTKEGKAIKAAQLKSTNEQQLNSTTKQPVETKRKSLQQQELEPVNLKTPNKRSRSSNIK